MSFIILPKQLFFDPKFKKLSVEAKVLYALLSDRTSLSKENGSAWMDKNGQYFVYFPQAEVMRYFACSHDKATSLMRELEFVGLIQCKRQGLGRPRRIFVNTTMVDAEKKHSV